MTDDVDKANDDNQRYLDAVLSQRKESGPVACGRCHNCGAAVWEGYRWCDFDCASDWQKRHAARIQRQLGRRDEDF